MNSQTMHRTALLPGPEPARFMGRKGNQYSYVKDPIGYTTMLYQNYGQVAGLVKGDARQAFFFGAEYNKYILNDVKCFHTVLETVTPEPIKARRKGIGLLNMNGDQHRFNRKLMMPAFHKNKIERYRTDFVEITNKLLDSWEGRSQIDVSQEMQKLTLQIVCKTLFGIDITDRSDRLGRLIKGMLDLPFFAPSVSLFPYDVPGLPYHRLLNLISDLDEELLLMVKKKRLETEMQHDVMSLLIHASDEEGNYMGDNELVGHATTLIIAGHETSSNTLAWTLFLLEQHPDILSDLLDELKGTLGGSPPGLAQLNELPLLDAVVKESLRLLPPGPNTSRVSTEDFELGGYAFSKGTFVTFSKYLTHRDPEIYEDPMTFHPGRWEAISPSPFEYFPFSAGPRMCIGTAFAMMEIKVILSMILQRYRLQLLPNSRIDREVNMLMAPRKMPMTLFKQDYNLYKTTVKGNVHEMVHLR
jgi:cytochrome P450